MRPHRLQPTRLPRPWASPGKTTGVGCHFLLQFLDWRSQYCYNDHTTQGNLQIQWNPYQITNGSFHRTRTKYINQYLEDLKSITNKVDFMALCSEKAMAPHSSTLAWRIPGTGEPGGLQSLGSHRVGHDWSDLAAAAAAAGAEMVISWWHQKPVSYFSVQPSSVLSFHH